MASALVTGAARNIGRAVAVSLAEAGHDIAILTRNRSEAAEETAGLVREHGVAACVVAADVRDRSATAAAIREATSRLGPVTVLVNNAAVREEQAFPDIGPDRWREVLAVILDGAFHCAQAVLPAMCDSGTGRIINVAGLSGQSGASHRAHVVTAKAGLLGFTKALAAEYAHRGITVNAVSPGAIDTARAVVPGHHVSRPPPVGRPGWVTEVATAVRYLASPAAAYVTGQTIGVNGGLFMP